MYSRIQPGLRFYQGKSKGVVSLCMGAFLVPRALSGDKRGYKGGDR